LAAEEDPSLVESAVKYIIFLADANLLFDTALGMYDFALVLMIAQQSQKVRLDHILRKIFPLLTHFYQDPREYLPFLRGLRSLESNYQKFKIDEHLKRYVKALSHIHLAGSTRRLISPHYDLTK
jgi:elongator complex protein 1